MYQAGTPGGHRNSHRPKVRKVRALPHGPFAASEPARAGAQMKSSTSHVDTIPFAPADPIFGFGQKKPNLRERLGK